MMSHADSSEATTPLVVLLFSVLRETAGRRRLEVRLDRSRSVGEVLDELVGSHPELAPFRGSMRAAVNRQYVDDAFSVDNGDELAIITPVSGG